MNWKKIKYFFKLHWIKMLLIISGLALIVGLVILLVTGIEAWNNAGNFMKQSQLAVIPLQLFLQLIMSIVFGVVYTMLWYYLFFKKGGRGFTQQKKKAVKGEEVEVTWNDVIGMEEAKQEASEVVKLIKDRADLQRIGGKILRGILMVGPPGCGKTYLAKAIATESKLPFIAMSGSEFVEMFVGVGASRIRSLFKQARDLATLEGGCIIFIDEIDAVGAQRATDSGFGGQTEFNTTLNQLLVEMDGLKDKDTNVIIIGATNAPMYFLDQALLRPGRFDRIINVGLPGLEDREKLFQYYLSKVKFDSSLNIPRLARRAVQKSPADISNIVREAALLAVRHEKATVTMKEINEAMDRIELGVKRNIKLTPREKEMTAYHEAGHAIVAYLLNPTDDVMKASIIPRADTLGVVYHVPREEIHNYDREKLLANIKVSIGSYVAEKIKFGTTTSGVDSDFRTALFFAHDMVWRWGMGDSGLLGNYAGLETRISGWSRSPRESVISEKVREQLNADTQKIMEQCLKEVEELLQKERPLLDRFAQELVKKQELDYDEIDAIFKEFHKSRPDSSVN
ncbi:MAG: AAA family ATPase [Candidatus Omnitrophica bacterium]|nr:AAA family ATPase [Candidatus Omnitrophota bacterium]MDD5352926.1 AAA family ATPase [Candidatus Omnitrophota bacterium]MDD5550525.1 AAA family ATPase [Candidatus Omnitrophota bacterium]